MPRVMELTLRIRTGAQGTETPVRICFNGHLIPPERSTGGTEPGEIFEGVFRPSSFAHHLSLEGPEAGTWTIDGLEVTYATDEGKPYEVRLGPVALDETTSVDIWRDRPPPTIDV